MVNLNDPVHNTTLPVDGRNYYFARFNITGSETEIIAAAAAALGKPVVHVAIEVTSVSTIRMKVNGNPASAANGKSVSNNLPWDARMKFETLHLIHSAGTNPAVVEVEFFSGE